MEFCVRHVRNNLNVGVGDSTGKYQNHKQCDKLIFKGRRVGIPGPKRDANILSSIRDEKYQYMLQGWPFLLLAENGQVNPLHAARQRR